MNIRLANNSDRAAWDEYVQNHLDGLAYHQYAWKLAVERAYGFEGFFLLAEDDTRILGVLPLIKLVRPLRSPVFVSLPYCDVGGILSDNLEIDRLLFETACSLAKEQGIKLLDIRNECAKYKTMVTGKHQKVRMVLHLPESDQELLIGFKAKLRSQVNKPLRDGLSAQLGGLELLDQFYAIFSENMRDLGSPVHAKEWFRSALEAFAECARVGLVFTPEGEPAAAGIILMNGRTVSIPWASSLRKLNRLNPNTLLYWTFLAFAANNGFKRFDFGRSSIDEGTYKFKEQWGAQPIPLNWISYDNGGRETTERENHTAKLRTQVEEFWRRLPLPVCNWIGPRVRRYISL